MKTPTPLTSSFSVARSRAGLTFASACVAAAATLSACGGAENNLPPSPPPPPHAPSSLASVAPPPLPTATAPATTATPAPALPPVALAAGTKAADPSPLPTVKITAPTKDQVIPADKANEFLVKLDVKNWATATGSSHVHLILDNKPYKPIFDLKSPVHLSELTGGEALTEGQHVLVAFPSRANHESVKTKDALFVQQFYVGKKGENKTDLKKPMLIYSRPKGEYKGEMANHVLIDFMLTNVTLAEGKEHVRVTVSGPGIDKPLTASTSTFGPPWFLDNLRSGQYTVQLELLDKDDKVVPGPWNATTRTITLERDDAAK